MSNTATARRGIAVAPHSLAAQSALSVLRGGGNAIDAGGPVAVCAPRWLPGRTWGSMPETLKLEARFAPQVIDELRRRSTQ